MRNDPKIWRTNEYKVARMFGGKRRRQQKWHTQGPDTFTDDAEIEVKTRNEIPGWLVGPLHKTSKFTGSRKTPIVIWIEKGQNEEDGIAVLFAADLKSLLAMQQAVKTCPRCSSGPPSPTPETPSPSTTTEK